MLATSPVASALRPQQSNWLHSWAGCQSNLAPEMVVQTEFSSFFLGGYFTLFMWRINKIFLYILVSCFLSTAPATQETRTSTKPKRSQRKTVGGPHHVLCLGLGLPWAVGRFSIDRITLSLRQWHLKKKR